MKFYLGSIRPNWLWNYEDGIPKFISRRTLSTYKNYHPAKVEWALDSGGFSELSLHGKWTVSPKQYCDEVVRFHNDIGSLNFAAIMDWMCEPFILNKTGFDVSYHQRKTVESYLELRHLNSDMRWMPVIQGFTQDEYMRCVDLYDKAGVDLTKQSVVGLGSVCRRQGTAEIFRISRTLYNLGVPLHGFGVKIRGLQYINYYLKSADSLAWAFAASKLPPMPGHTHKHCQNCYEFAVNWYNTKIKGKYE